jgi:hypothetical protein
LYTEILQENCIRQYANIFPLQDEVEIGHFIVYLKITLVLYTPQKPKKNNLYDFNAMCFGKFRHNGSCTEYIADLVSCYGLKPNPKYYKTCWKYHIIRSNGQKIFMSSNYFTVPLDLQILHFFIFFIFIGHRDIGILRNDVSHCFEEYSAHLI